MAFGFPPTHSKNLRVDGMSPKRSFAIAFEAANKLDWNIEYISEEGFTARTKFSWSSWSEFIQVKIEFHNINIRSSCSGNQIVDWGKNEKNIEEFVKTYARIKENMSPKELDEKYLELQNSFVDESHSNWERESLSENKTISILSIFQARNGYFVTPTLLGVNIVIYIIMVMLGVHFLNPDVETLIKWGANYPPVTLDDQWWRLVSCCFIHVGIDHLLFNMYALVYIGLIIEPQLGKSRFLSAYLISGIAASLSSLSWNDMMASAGASGAVFGMYGVFLAMLTTNSIGKSTKKSFLVSMLFFVGYNLINGMNEGIDNAAHIGGLASGLIIGYIYYPSLKRPKIRLLRTGTILFLIIVVLLSSFLVLNNTPNDIVIFDKNMDKFSRLESKALEIYKMPSDISNEDLLNAIQNKSISSWNTNLTLLKQIDSLNISEHHLTRNKLLIEYCQLRIESCQLLYRSISENSSEFLDDIDMFNQKIEEKINEISLLQ